MKKKQKIASFALVTTITGGLLLGALPTSTYAATSKVTNTQSSLKNQINTYVNQLNTLKKEFNGNNDDLAEYYYELQNYTKDFTKYHYSGIDVLKSNIAKFKARLDKTRKDNSSIDMKKVTATFNSYLKKNDKKNVTAYYTKQRSSLLAILKQQENLMSDIEDYMAEVDSQIEQENEVYIQTQIPTEYGNYELEAKRTFTRAMDLLVKDQEIMNQAYQVLNMNYTIKTQIEADLEKISVKYTNLKSDDSIGMFGEANGVNDAIQERNVEKTKTAIQQALKKIESLNHSIDQLIIELDQYKENLPKKFSKYVKTTSTTK
jgi:hypothetical protein